MKKIGWLAIAVFFVSSVMFGLTATAKTTFKDVPSKHWALKDIEFLTEKKVINGYPNGNFGLNDKIKRVDAAAMIVRSLGLSTNNRPDPGFKDVARNSDGYAIIATVVDEGIFEGTDGKFQPNKTLTRAEMAAIINRAFPLDQGYTSVYFSDISKHWAYRDIQALVANEITTGYEDNAFRPNQPTTRAEFAAFMTRVIQGIDGNEENPDEKKDELEKDKEELEKDKDKENEGFEVIGIY